MGLIASLFGYGVDTGRTDDPDSVTGLTSRDKYLVKTSWDVVRKKPTENGTTLLLQLFKNHPGYQQLFPFRDIPLKDLAANKRYQAHCNAIIYAFSSIVDSLDDNELLVTILTKIGESHISRNASKDSFKHLKETTIQVFSTFMNEAEIEAWKKTLDCAYSVMMKPLK